MPNQKEKIMRFSKVVYILLLVAFVMLIAVAVLQAVAWILALLDVMPTSPAFEHLFSIEFWNVRLIFGEGVGIYLASTSFSLLEILVMALWMIQFKTGMSIFNHLRITAQPFSLEMVVWLKRLSDTTIVLGIVTFSFSTLLIAAIFRALAMIFEYGRSIQRENDSIL